MNLSPTSFYHTLVVPARHCSARAACASAPSPSHVAPYSRLAIVRPVERDASLVSVVNTH